MLSALAAIMIRNPVYIFLFILIACHPKQQESISIPEGGYPFLTEVKNKDFPFYPIIDSVLSRDSFIMATYWRRFYNSYEEPNLSLSPSKEYIARFVFSDTFLGYSAVVTLSGDTLRVKQIVSGQSVPWNDENKLDSLERVHFHLLGIYFPLDKYEGSPRKNLFVDSLTKVYPKLLASSYYQQLWNKSLTIKEPFTYRKWNIPLSQSKVKELIQKINNSGYWQMKHDVSNCSGAVTHPNFVTLEVATSLKYNYVSYLECDGDNSEFAKLCQEIMKYAKIEENREKWYEDFRRKKQLTQ